MPQLVEGGWFGRSIVNGHVIVLEKVLVVGWRKEILWTRDGEGLTTRCMIKVNPNVVIG